MRASPRHRQPTLGSLRPLLAPVVTAAAVLLAASCSSEATTQPTTETPSAIRIGSFDFSESELVAELYAQTLEGEGFPVRRMGVVGPREIVAPALEGGLLDVVPEYLGTASQHYSPGTSEDAEIDAALRRRGLVLLTPAPAENVNVVVVTELTAARHDLQRVSDLLTVAPSLAIGGPVECPDRPLCLQGLTETYGLHFSEFVPLRTLTLTAEALLREEIAVGVMFSTAAELESGPFVVLADDRQLQPAENITPLVRIQVLERLGPGVAASLDSISEHLTTTELRGLNRAVAEGAPITVAAQRWLETLDGES